MAHFAELDNNNKVLRVLVFDNADVEANGGDKSESAASFCETIVPFSATGVKWVQTSYNNNFRKQYAGEGYTYDSSKDIFIAYQPFPSWTLNSNNDWEAPIPYHAIVDDGSGGTTYIYWISWNEDSYQADNNTGWQGIRSNDTSETPTFYRWNGTSWIS